MSRGGGDILTALFLGFCLSFAVMGLLGLNPVTQRGVGHDQGVCDMACHSRAEVSEYGTQLRCICGGGKRVVFFNRSK